MSICEKDEQEHLNPKKYWIFNKQIVEKSHTLNQDKIKLLLCETMYNFF